MRAHAATPDAPLAAPLAGQAARVPGRRAADRISRTQLHRLTSSLIKVREQERARIARELHDDCGQRLSALRLDLALLLRDEAVGAPARTTLARMDAQLLETIAALRRIATGLRPRALDESDLYFALQGLARECAGRGLTVRLGADADELQLPEDISTDLYRIVQEALNNVLHHAKAQVADVCLSRLDHEMRITITDDGKGISDDDQAKPGALGLLGMRERVWALHGTIRIGRAPGRGTQVDIRLPVPAPERPAPA
jgi:signal transduction histidine kinase